MSVKILYGAYGFGGHPEGDDQRYLDILTEHGVKDIDTAYIYVSLVQNTYLRKTGDTEKET